MKKAFEQIKTADNKKYTPVALLGQQVVAGMNYKILCRENQTDTNKVGEYKIFTIYNSLDKKASLSATFDFVSAK